TSSLTITGTAAARHVTCHGFALNQFYRITITAVDTANAQTVAETSFDTFSQDDYMFEAEDFNFNGGQFIDDVVLSSFPSPNNYIDTTGIQYIDRYDPNPSGLHNYRYYSPVDGSGEWVGTEPVGQAENSLRNKYNPDNTGDPAVVDYHIGSVDEGEWWNYTRTFPSGTYRVYARFAYAGPGIFGARLDSIVSGASTTNQTAVPLGHFLGQPTGDAETYAFFPLQDAFGDDVELSLGGASTFRCTSLTEGVNANFYILVPTETFGTMLPYLAAASPLPGAVDANPQPVITLAIANRDTQVQSGTVQLWFNGTNITGNATVSVTGAGTAIAYQPPALLPAGSTNKVALVFSDNGTPANTVSNQWQFVVRDYSRYPVLPPADRVADGAVDLTQPGFTVRPHQIAVARPGPNGDENLLPAPENELDDLIINPATGRAYDNLAIGGANPDGSYDEPGQINYNTATDSTIGTLGYDGHFVPDTAVPGIPGSTGSKDHFVVEILTYLDLKAGVYRCGVNCKDGFLVSAALNPRDRLGLRLGLFDGSRPASDTLFDFVVSQSGIYPFRLLWWQGTGDASLEFFAEGASGHLVLINDRSNPQGIKAYRRFTGTAAPYVKSVSPYPNATGVDPNAAIQLLLAQGAGAPISMSVNGVNVTPTVTSSDSNAFVNYTPSSLFASGSTNTAAISFSAGVTDSWAFVTARYATLPEGLAVVEGIDTNAVGFEATVVQAPDPTRLLADSIDRAESQLAGTLIDPTTGQPYPNIALPGPGPNGAYFVTNTINWNINSGGLGPELGDFQSPDFPDDPIPGIPGAIEPANYNNIAVQVLTYLYLPAGYFQLGVNSDDGFRVTAATDAATNALELGAFDGSRDPAASLFAVLVPKDAFYPVRLVYEQGGGNASLEFFSIGPDGGRILINDRGNPAAVRAYYRLV
ncbi:MAG: hypothetical protein M1608_16910, partial [Candidatus Omnitrophica bacterium]|nr:hypothetical protein [Candidatus Omnitrophota bacterium]